MFFELFSHIVSIVRRLRQSEIHSFLHGGVGFLIEKPEGFPTRPPPTPACLPAGGKGIIIYIKKESEKVFVR